MTQTIRTQNHIIKLISFISLMAWVIILIEHYNIFNYSLGEHTHHHSNMHHDISESHSTVELFTSIFSANKLLNWFIMLLAMMSLTLISPLQHVWESSLKRKRMMAVFLFSSGYISVWMLVGIVIMLVGSILNNSTAISILPIISVLLMTIVWQFSPLKQVCLNRNHNHSAIKAFGFAAYIDSIKFGLKHGFWCVGSCWAMMLLPLLFKQWHILVMFIVTLIMFSESIEKPTHPQWHFRYPNTMLRLLFFKFSAGRL